MQLKRSLLAALAPLVFSPPLAGQDTFEIQVYEYETEPKGTLDLELHLNYIGQGTLASDGTVAPTDGQIHTTFELTWGITRDVEAAGYLCFANRPGFGWEYAGWRVRARGAVPKEWNWPVGVGLSVEAGFMQRTYEENSVGLEIRPIVEKSIGRWTFTINPTVTRALRGPGTDEGWGFEPSARIGFSAIRRLDVSLEYYGGLGPFGNFPAVREQVQQIYPGGDWEIAENLSLNFGVGVALTPAGNDLVAKIRLGYLFGGS
jgi:hypothetical protein